MDSVTQFTLGASVAALVVGPKLGMRAILLGGVVATLPDLDSFLPATNVIDKVTYHRGFSHSLLVQTALSPAIAYVAHALFKNSSVSYLRMLLTVWLCLITHSLLDSLTTYGTQLFWPLEAGSPVAFPSVFIIDPFYTITLLVGVIGYLFLIHRNRRRAMKMMRVCVGLSTFYLTLGMGAHLLVKSRAEALPALAGTKIHVQPMPFNILYWQILAVDKAHYYTGATSALRLCPLVKLKQYPRLDRLSDTASVSPSVKRFEWFSDGFFSYVEQGERVLISDLRIGYAPFFPFTFDFAGKGQASFASEGEQQMKQVPAFIETAPRRVRGKGRDMAYLSYLYGAAREVPEGCSF